MISLKKEEIQKYLNKNVRILLKGSFTYHGYIISVDDTSITINDKFHEKVTIDLHDISTIGEYNGAK